MWRAVEAFTLHLLSIFLKSRLSYSKAMLKAAPLLSLLGSCRQEGGACPVLTHLGPLLASATVLASGVVGAAGVA